MITKKVLVFPGAFQCVKNYGGLDGVDIWLSGNSSGSEDLTDPDCIVGHSAGGAFALVRHINLKTKFVLINPLIPQRSIPGLFVSWIKFFVFEGIPFKKIVGLKHWPHSFKLLYHLIGVNTMDLLKTIPKENVVVVRGKKDNFYCTDEAVKLLKENNIEVVEVDAGHDWNDKVAEEVGRIVSKL